MIHGTATGTTSHRRCMALYRRMAATPKASSVMPISASPVILRLLDGPHLPYAIMKGPSLYPRRRLTFSKDLRLQEIFRSTEGRLQDRDDLGVGEWPYSRYRFVFSMPALYHTLLMVTRLDMYSPITWITEAALIGAAFYATQYIRKEKMKTIKHILVGPEFNTITIGFENMTNEATGDIPPSHITAMPGTTYKNIPFNHLLFVGYSQAYSKIKSGEGVMEAENNISSIIQTTNEKPSWYLEAFKQGLNKQKLLITIIYFDQEANKYVEGLVDPNYSQLPELEDYLMSLVDKKKIKFFSTLN